jgi:zinc/manganese transport system substrate-binding protein
MRKILRNALQRWLATVFLRPAPLLTAALVIFLGAQPGRASAAELLPVVASFSILGDLTRRVGGEHVQVYTLVGPLADAHVYQPTPADVKKLARARLVVVNGLGFEGWIDRLIMSSGYRGPIVVASKGVKALQKEAAPAGKHRTHDHPADVDPHAWQDLAQARYYVDNIAAALAQVDPANKVSYQANAAALQKQIDVLDSEIRSSLSKLPVERRVVVSSHDAFGYFARAYGIRFLAPVGVSTDAQPSAARRRRDHPADPPGKDPGNVHRERQRPTPARTHQRRIRGAHWRRPVLRFLVHSRDGSRQLSRHDAREREDPRHGPWPTDGRRYRRQLRALCPGWRLSAAHCHQAVTKAAHPPPVVTKNYPSHSAAAHQ